MSERIDTDAERASAVRPGALAHTTHHDDCGCLRLRLCDALDAAYADADVLADGVRHRAQQRERLHAAVCDACDMLADTGLDDPEVAAVYDLLRDALN